MSQDISPIGHGRGAQCAGMGPPALPPHLQHDCTRCAALCCVAPAFDAVQGFGYDKPAHTACRHLAADHRCTVHGGLAGAGFPACAVFDCHGAGQRATAQFGGPQALLDDTARRHLYAHYQRLVRLHDLLHLLHLAADRSGDDAVKALLGPHAERLEAACGQPPRALTDAQVGQLHAAGLQALRDVAHRLGLPR